MINVKAVYNPRKPNGDINNTSCDFCNKVGSAYIKLPGYHYWFQNDVNYMLICKGCLEDWGKLINNIILKDVMDSVHRRKEKENV